VEALFSYSFDSQFFSTNSTTFFSVSSDPSDLHYSSRFLNFNNTYQNYKLKFGIGCSPNFNNTEFKLRVFMKYMDAAGNKSEFWEK